MARTNDGGRTQFLLNFLNSTFEEPPTSPHQQQEDSSSSSNSESTDSPQESSSDCKGDMDQGVEEELNSSGSTLVADADFCEIFGDPMSPHSSKLAFLNSLGLITHDMARKIQEKGEKRRQRSTCKTPSPKYDDFDLSMKRKRRRSTPKDVEKSESDDSEVGNVKKPKVEDGLKCGACHEFGTNLKCSNCSTKYHAQCIRVGGSKAPLVPSVDICPSCCHNPRPIKLRQHPLEHEKSKGDPSKPRINRIRRPPSRFIRSPLKMNMIFPSIKKPKVKGVVEKIKMKVKRESPRRYGREKPMSEAQIKETLLSMSKAAKIVIENRWEEESSKTLEETEEPNGVIDWTSNLVLSDINIINQTPN